jgi:Mn2+/Fe2+ NRAMP family transporter
LHSFGFQKLFSLYNRKKRRERLGSAEDRGIVLPFETSGVKESRLGRVVPGIIAGAADLDPAAVLTATVAGASFGLSVAWIVILCIPILMSVLGVSARIGHETRLGLIQLVRIHFGKKWAATLAGMVVAVNVLMIVADVSAVSEALSIVLAQPPIFFTALVAFAVWYILTLAGYQKVNRTLSLIALFLFAYVAAAFLSSHSLWTVAKKIAVPAFSSESGYVLALVAVFGSLLTPDVIVWQTSTKRESGSFYEAESMLGCVVAAVVSLCVIIAASTMNVSDPANMTSLDAARALSSLGELGPVLFALGIIGSGMVALPILVASLCFSISEAADWHHGLNKNPWDARGFFVLICGVLLAAVCISFIGVNTVRTLYWSQVLAGIFIVPILFFILWISNDRRIMRSTNTRWQNGWLGFAVVGMIVANLIFFALAFVG